MVARLKLNEIRSVIKMENFNKEGPMKVWGSFSEKVAKEVFAVKRFTMVTKI